MAILPRFTPAGAFVAVAERLCAALAERDRRFFIGDLHAQYPSRTINRALLPPR